MPTRGRRECASACDTQACLAGLLHNCACAYLYRYSAALCVGRYARGHAHDTRPGVSGFARGRDLSWTRFRACSETIGKLVWVAAPTAATSGPRFLLPA